MERLFGRKPKKSSASSPSQAAPAPYVASEDEGFSVVSSTPSNQPALYHNFNNVYPTVNPVPAAALNGVSSSSNQTSGGSNNVGAYLDGVPFKLSSRCAGVTDLDAISARVEHITERIRNVDWSAADYDFRLERSVVSQDITNSLRRLHTTT
jgi:hypothetical protein